MAVKIGSARSSYGNTSPGDQSEGREVSTQDWYLHGSQWHVFRAKDAMVREKIALAMERACANDDIGYSQGSRNSLRDNVKAKGFDPARTSKKVNCDCSSLVRVCCNFAGVMAGDFTTSSQKRKLLATGAFVLFDDDAHCKGDQRLLRGDILCTRKKGHTVVVLSDGEDAAQEAETIAGDMVEITGGSVNLRSGPSTAYGVVDTLKKGERLVYADPGNWIPVVHGGKIRWVSGNYAKLKPGV